MQEASPDLLDLSNELARPLNHRTFRYPAKFHAPVARALLRAYTAPGETVLDPFCGSGTLLAEAATMSRSCVGSDVDPVAVEVAWSKVTDLPLAHLEAATQALQASLRTTERRAEFYGAGLDIHDDELHRELDEHGLALPTIPNIGHWFRRYVLVDLARIQDAIAQLDTTPIARRFLTVVFGSIIRNCSNADPVPVSGLEVTGHMRRLEQRGRVVNPHDQMRKALKRALTAHASFLEERSASASCRVIQADATDLPADIGPVDALITSPPYNNAVDYYRRHTLEMYWMGLTDSHKERLGLLPKYLGRPRVPASNPLLANWEPSTGLVAEWSKTIHAKDQRRGRDFDHYMAGMTLALTQFHGVVKPAGTMVLVVGRSSWNGEEIPTDALFRELAHDQFEHVHNKYYPIKNRYMSYTRHNGADIKTEEVIVFRRK